MKKINNIGCFIFCFITIFTCIINIYAKSIDDVPIISVKSDKTINSFLQAVCDDIYIKSNKKFIFNSDLMSSGYHSNVYKLNGEEYDLCVKVFKPGLLRRLSNEYQKEHKKYYDITELKYEENFLKQLDNEEIKNILLPIAAYKSKYFFANISKYGGSLQLADIIKNKIILDEQTAATIIYDILKGLESLHSKNYSHNDLHSWNIVINFKDGKYIATNIVDCGNVYKKIKKIWYDIASVIGYKILRYINLLTLSHIWPYINLNTGYYDAQDLKCAFVDSNSDIFATGIMMWELLFGNCPFAGCNLNEISTNKAILKLEDSINLLENNKTVSNNCKDLLLKLLTPTKDKRISASEALKHKFFQYKAKSIDEDILKK